MNMKNLLQILFYAHQNPKPAEVLVGCSPDMRGKCRNMSFCAAEMMLSLSQPDGDKTISLS